MKVTLHTLGRTPILETDPSSITNIIAHGTNRPLYNRYINAVAFYTEAGEAAIPRIEARSVRFPA